MGPASVEWCRPAFDVTGDRVPGILADVGLPERQSVPLDDDTITVVIVHWNQPRRLAATIDAFRDQGRPVHFLIVDNGSEPWAKAELAALAGATSDVEVLSADRNLGFGPAANVGFRRWYAGSTAAWVALAPHDALPAPRALDEMLALIAGQEARSGGRVGLACADVGDGKVPVFDPYLGAMSVAASLPLPAGGVGWEPADYPHGTLLLARRACLDEVGVFDERYFAYCEESDLGLRAKAGGWQVGITRGVMVHNPSMRSGAAVVDYLMHRNTLLLVREWSGRYHAIVRLAIALVHLVRGLVQPSSRSWLFSARGRWAGIVDHLRGRHGTPPSWLFEPPPQRPGPLAVGVRGQPARKGEPHAGNGPPGQVVGTPTGNSLRS